MAARKTAATLSASVPAAFPSALKSAREALGIDPIAAARRCKVKRSTYYSWESGARAPRPSDFPAIAAAMRTTVATLYGEAA